MLQRINAENIAFHLSKNIVPLYILSGNDLLLVDESKNEIITSAQAVGFDEKFTFDIDAHFNFETLMEKVQSVGLFSSKQLFILNFGENISANISKKLQQFCTMLNDDILLILHFPKLTLAHQKAKWFTQITEQSISNAVLVNCTTIAPAKMPEFINNRCKKLQISLSKDALTFLIFNFENNLIALNQCLQTLQLMGIKTEITVKEIEQTIENSSQFTPFQLIDALLEGKIKRAFRILKHIENEETPPLMLVRLIQKELITLLELGSSSFKGDLHQPFNTSDFSYQCEQMKIWQSKRSFYLAFLQRKTPMALLDIIKHLANTERALKQSFDASYDDFEKLVMLFN